jgi:hypothetical protein
MPPQLLEFHFEDWHDPGWDADYEPGGHFQHYLARTEWLDARRRWMDGEEWPPMIESPRPVQRDSVKTDPIRDDAAGGVPPQVNRARSVPQSRPINLR